MFFSVSQILTSYRIEGLERCRFNSSQTNMAIFSVVLTLFVVAKNGTSLSIFLWSNVSIIALFITIFRSEMFITIPMMGSIGPFTVTSTMQITYNICYYYGSLHISSCMHIDISCELTHIIVPMSIGIVTFWVNLQILFSAKLFALNMQIEYENGNSRSCTINYCYLCYWPVQSVASTKALSSCKIGDRHSSHLKLN